MAIKPDLIYEAVIAAKDAETTIAETIESLLGSHIPPRTIWVIDDGSSDDTGKFARDFERVTVLENTQNRERSFSRNRGLQECTAPFIQILDADDLLAPDKTKIQLCYLQQNPKVDMVYGSRVSFTGKFQLHSTDPPLIYPKDSDLLEQVLTRNIIIPGMMMFRSRFFEQFGFFDESIKIAEDRELIIRALTEGATVEQTPEAYTYYRRHPGSSVEKSYADGIYNGYLMFNKLFDQILAHKDGAYRIPLANSYRALARNLNIYGYAFHLVEKCIEKSNTAYPSGSGHIEQNKIYKLIEKMLGPCTTERILRVKFKLDHQLGRYK